MRVGRVQNKRGVVVDDHWLKRVKRCKSLGVKFHEEEIQSEV